MKQILFILLLSVVGCQRHKSPDSAALPVISSVDMVSLNDIPQDASIIGNIDIVPAIFGLTVSSVKVYIKPSQNESWVEIEPNKTGQPTYVYDMMANQLRFKWCYEGWGYAIVTY